MPIKKVTVIQDVITALEGGALIPSKHALLQMKERNIDLSDVEEAVYRAVREEQKDSLTEQGMDWKYAIRGMNDNGDKDLRLVVVYLDAPKMLLVTAIDKNK
ncbi:MAG: hypothetical protein A2X86_10950 [Bdellovibrionales bacterium GWA2_49_15]|nr:MAG: hypothetical protein A2X86_10950 [Bdellovibrionales bacterium GWA2_49_15]HAZ11494.1 hypothetical protein [Bdellovibrionales bacterium]